MQLRKYAPINDSTRLRWSHRRGSEHPRVIWVDDQCGRLTDRGPMVLYIISRDVNAVHQLL